MSESTTTQAGGTPLSKEEAAALSDRQWRERLSAEQYAILRKAGTERAFTGAYWDTKTPGLYKCAACGTDLFRSDTKFESGSGWPSFTRAVDPDAVDLREDRSHWVRRTEVLCATCGGHLGHVFDDGPRSQGGQRFCMNSASLDLEPTDG